MNFFDATILGIVEGLTEFLPVSSTGHLILASHVLGLPGSDFVKSFEIAIQFGAILAVVALYWRKLSSPAIIKILLAGFLPTAIIGLVLYSTVKKYLLGNESVVLWALLLGGVALIAFEFWHKQTPEENIGVENITLKQAVLVGLAQSVAIVPGVSRSAASIVGGLWLGLPRTTVVEFSFLLAVPTMVAATGLDLVKSYSVFGQSEWGLLAAGFMVSFFVALAVIKFLLWFVRTRTFVPFGVYRILLAIFFFLFLF